MEILKWSKGVERTDIELKAFSDESRIGTDIVVKDRDIRNLSHNDWLIISKLAETGDVFIHADSTLSLRVRENGGFSYNFGVDGLDIDTIRASGEVEHICFAVGASSRERAVIGTLKIPILGED